MTVTSTNRINTYLGAGSVGPYAYTFRIFENADLQVFVTAADGTITPLVLATDYTVTGAGAEIGGTVTLTVPLAVGTTLTIERTLLIEQLTDLRNQGEFFPATYEDALDYGIMVSQQLADGVASLIAEVTANTASITTLTTNTTTNTTDITNLTSVVNSHTVSLTTITAELVVIDSEIAALQQQVVVGRVRRLAAVLAAGTHSGYTPGPTTTRIEFEGWGAGGGAGQFGSESNCGGGGGAYCFGAVDCTAGDTFTVDVGAGGVGSTGGNSTDGGDSTVTRDADSHVVINAGGGGSADGATNGGGGAVNVADFGIAGEYNDTSNAGYRQGTAPDTNFGFYCTQINSRGGNAPRGGYGGRFSGNFGAGQGIPQVPGGGGGAQTILPASTNAKSAQDGADGLVLVWEWS